MKEIQKILCDALKSHLNRDPTEDESQQLMRALTSFRGLFNAVIDHPKLIINECLSTGHSTSLIFPCDVVELRQILGGSISINSSCVPMFASGFAERYLKTYPVFLILRQNNVSVDLIELGGVVLAQCSELSVEGNVGRVVVNQPSSNTTISAVKRIIQDCLPEVEMLVSNSVPGISSPSRQLAGKSKENIKTAQSLEIDINPSEAQLFNKLKNLRDKAGLSNVEMRVAGGWVRDKLLGIDSADIDIALSNMTGAEFVQKLGIGGAVIQANPDRSKHLETVKAKIDGQEVDFTNLRSEAYADTRVPEMQMGTPQEDANRRDFTINAMFFNLETGQVEDYTGGKADLEQGIIKTPLDAKQTFQDDPLRVLRALRFFARYPGFKLDPSIIEAMQDPEVQDDYRNKVASERAGKEFFGKDEEGNYKGIAIGDNAADAIEILLKTGFYKSVFDVEQMGNLRDIDMEQKTPHHDLTVMGHTVESIRNLQKMMKENDESKRMIGLMVLSSMFHDFGKLHPDIEQPHPKKEDQMRYIGHEDVSSDAAGAIMKRMGIGEQDRRVVETVIQNHMRPHLQGWTPRSMGKFIRKTTVPGQEDLGLWKYIMYHSIADSQAKGTPKEEDITEKQNLLGRMTEYVDQRSAQPVAPIGKPILNGHEIMSLIPELQPSTGFIPEVQEMLLEFADAGEINNPDQARQKVLEWKNQNLQKYQLSGEAMNWFQKIKKADGQGGGGGGDVTEDSYNYYEGTPGGRKDKEITRPQDIAYKDTLLEDQFKDVSRIKRHPVAPQDEGPAFERTEGGGAKYNDTVKIPFQEGERIRDRRRGTAMKQRFGKITVLDNRKGKLSVKWDDAEDSEDIPLNDTVTLAAILGRA